MSEDAAIYFGRSIQWAGIEQPAREMFTVWMDGSEMQWAQKAWEMLEAARLTVFGTALDETRVRIRLLALAAIYRDFCALGMDESWEGGVGEGWASLLELNDFRIAQLVGDDFESSDFDSTASELVDTALLRIAEEERRRICAVLVGGFGGAAGLTQALFATVPTRFDDRPAGRNAFDEKPVPAGLVFNWIDGGMCSL